MDECCYEGNIRQGWGNITAQEMVRRFWDGHGAWRVCRPRRDVQHPEDILWWAKGGDLHGESAPRLAFLRQILEDGPAAGLDPIDDVIRMFACAGRPHEYYLTYFGVHQPAHMAFNLPEGEQYRAEVIDTWAMTTTPLGEPVVRGAAVRLAGKPYQALILRRVD